jgi:hypothetical protein
LPDSEEERTDKLEEQITELMDGLEVDMGTIDEIIKEDIQEDIKDELAKCLYDKEQLYATLGELDIALDKANSNANHLQNKIDKDRKDYGNVITILENQAKTLGNQYRNLLRVIS